MLPAARPPTIIQQPCLVLVEGVEDQRFWEAVFRQRRRGDVQVIPVGGKNSLRARLLAITEAPGFDRVRWIGVIQDADDDPRAAFDRICGAFNRAQLTIPRHPWTSAGSAPTTVAIILPDGDEAGDLELLVWRAIANDPAIPCVEGYFRCLADMGVPLPRQQAKAYLHAFLASREAPDRRIGDAAADGLLPLDSPVFDRLLGLLPDGA